MTWDTNGCYDQKPIAELMGVMAENGTDPEFVLAAGDVHHFEGVRSVNDPLWMTNYELIFGHPELMIDWFPLLGNHDTAATRKPYWIIRISAAAGQCPHVTIPKFLKTKA